MKEGPEGPWVHAASSWVTGPSGMSSDILSADPPPLHQEFMHLQDLPEVGSHQILRSFHDILFQCLHVFVGHGIKLLDRVQARVDLLYVAVPGSPRFLI